MTLPAAPSFADYISSRNAHRQTCLPEPQACVTVLDIDAAVEHVFDSVAIQKITCEHLPVVQAPLAFNSSKLGTSCDAGYLSPPRPRRLLTSAGSAPTRAIPDFYNQLSELVECFQNKPQPRRSQGKRARNFISSRPYYLKAQAQKKKSFWMADWGKKLNKFFKAKLKDLAKFLDALAVA
jgi:hypothetical protein